MNFVENERPVIISRVQLNNLMNWKCTCKWGRRGGVIVGGWEGGRLYKVGLRVWEVTSGYLSMERESVYTCMYAHVSTNNQ